MNPPPEPTDLVQRLRQQLILAQVRIMELEDARDASASKLAEAERLTQAAQSLADLKLAEAAHLTTVLADLRARHESSLATQRETDAQLAAARTDLKARDAELRESRAAYEALDQSRARFANELDATTRSRSWRWTAWLRLLERLLGR